MLYHTGFVFTIFFVYFAKFLLTHREKSGMLNVQNHKSLHNFYY